MLTMGKKGGKRKRAEEEQVEDAEEREADELDAELAAVLAMRNEKALNSNVGDGKENGSTKSGGSQSQNTYNKEGLQSALESIGTNTLSYIESLQVCKYTVDVHEENDDLQREVVSKPTIRTSFGLL